MKGRRIFMPVMAVMVLSLVGANLFAEEKKYELNTASDIKDILKEQIGKTVTIKSDSGRELEGVVTQVGDHLVHIARLSEKNFYDAVMRIDKIHAVIFKVREAMIRTTK
jgi:small nuclear ribonucleoprotein (snRNP)-like protein